MLDSVATVLDSAAQCCRAILDSAVETLALQCTSTPKVPLVCYALAGLTSVNNELLINSELLGMGLIESDYNSLRQAKLQSASVHARVKLTRTFNTSVRAAERVLSQDH